MTEKQKEIKKWSNEQRVEALAKFIALRSEDPRKALLYGFMLDCLLDEINKGQRRIEKRFDEFEAELEKKDKIIDLMVPRVYLSEQERENMKEEYTWTSNKPKDFSNCVKQYFEKKAEE